MQCRVKEGLDLTPSVLEEGSSDGLMLNKAFVQSSFDTSSNNASEMSDSTVQSNSKGVSEEEATSKRNISTDDKSDFKCNEENQSSDNSKVNDHIAANGTCDSTQESQNNVDRMSEPGTQITNGDEFKVKSEGVPSSTSTVKPSDPVNTPSNSIYLEDGSGRAQSKPRPKRKRMTMVCSVEIAYHLCV